MTLVDGLWLEPILPILREQALDAFAAGDAVGFLCSAGNTHGLDLVARNASKLKERGMYEEALLHAFMGTRGNNHHWPQADLECAFRYADQARLRELSDPLPGDGPFTLYRGVAGRGASRRVRGLSWTADVDQAVWFAKRFPLPDPAVFKAVVPATAVLARLHEMGRNEDEYIVLLPSDVKVIRELRLQTVSRTAVALGGSI